MAGNGHDYHRGEMDIHEQAATYAGFGLFTKWGSLALAVLLLTITMWFCTDAGFFAGAISGVVLAVLGVVILKEKPTKGH
jgi:hypothetical protein